jgi:uncharacterized protein HemX
MVPRPKLPFRRSKDDASEAETKEAKSTKATAKKAVAKKSAAKAPAKAAAKKPPAPNAPPANITERMEGLQGWMAEIERKQGRMTYFGAAAAAVAVLASGAALYLGITTQQDSVDKDDFESLEQRVTEVGDSLKSSTEEQLKTLNGKVTSIEGRLGTIEQKQTQLDTTIKNLQNQVNQQPAPGGANAAPGTTTTPDTGANANP